MVTYGDGQVGSINVPKKALAAQEVIYQGSTLLSVMEKAGIPTIMTKDLMYRTDVTKGVAGEDQVAVDAEIDPKRVTYTQLESQLVWSNYTYDILESAKLNSREPNAIWENNIKAASEFFGAIKDYRTLSALGTAAMNSAAATATWGSAGADPENDIVTGLSKLMEKSNMQSGEKVSIVVPAKVFYEVNKLTLINNIQRTVRDYLEKSFDLQLFAYRPMVNAAGTAVYDGLTTTALMFVQGKNTAQQLVFDPAEANARGVPLVEHERVFSRGDRYVQKMATACIPIWDGVATFTSKTSYKTNRIYKITSVCS